MPKHQVRSSSCSDLDGDVSRVLRSGKRFAVSNENECVKDSDENGSNLKLWWRDEVAIWNYNKEREKLFGAVYSRKRKRNSIVKIPNSDNLSINRYGIVYEKRKRKVAKEVSSSLEEKEEIWGLKKFGDKLGLSESEISSEAEKRSDLVLGVIVESCAGLNSDRFQRFLLTMMKARIEFCDLVLCVCFGTISHVFSMNGMHFLPLKQQINCNYVGNIVPGCGICMIYGDRNFIPLLSVDYASLPYYFMYLHENIFLASSYFPSFLRDKHLVPVHENSLMIVPYQTVTDCNDAVEKRYVETPLRSIKESSEQISRSLAIVNGFKPKKYRRKRSVLKNSNSLNRSFSMMTSRYGLSRSKRDFPLGHINVKPLNSCLSDLFHGKDHDGSLNPQSCQSMKKSSSMRSSPNKKIKEMRFALEELRQNIDSTCCRANLLVCDSEKCWRESGVQVTMEMSNSHEWFISVKKDGITQFMHKPQDLRQCVVNRFTHAYMWSGEDRWKLEFQEKWDWHIFKILHIECRDRNSQDAMKVIPVPGVREVLDYENNVVSSFVRPNVYIHVATDEVERALDSKTSYYDMDFADEEWLQALNSRLDVVNDSSSFVTEENFERIIFALEKMSYSCMDDIPDKETAVELCKEMASRSMVSAIYDYWIQKRRKKSVPLVKVFQGPPTKKTSWLQKPFRKKRSFKRQRIHAERSDSNLYVRSKPERSHADEESIKKVQEAKEAADKAADIAIKLRARAQQLMANADLATYRAAMALKIAEIKRLSSSGVSILLLED